MGEKRPTAKICMTIGELTMADGKTTGFVETSVTENGRTETFRQEIGQPGRKRSKRRPTDPTPHEDRAHG